MGLIFRKRLGPLNISKRGVSASGRAGRVTLNSRGRGSVRIAPGLSFRFRWKR